MGETLELSAVPDVTFDVQTADEMNIAHLYHEPMRPQIHFSTKNGWINDPNGLIYLDGTYHMFYQYNPAEPNWGNMHWGHAESRDLIHWEEKNIALFPDDRGAMFSGSAVPDVKNLLGKNVGDKPAAVLFYTTMPPYCQHMSYSSDNFKTVIRLSDKPIIPHIVAFNRDPKVVFCDELDCYLLALYMDEDIYSIFRSDDLVTWNELQQVHIEGENECPDIFPITDSEGTRKWIIMGAHDRYLVGSFDSGKFAADQPAQSLHYGNSGYAGQSFSNLPNHRIVRIVWDRWLLPAAHFNGQMGIPMEMSLSKHDGFYYLQANPVEELQSICQEAVIYRDLSLFPETPFCEALKRSAYQVKLRSKTPEHGVVTVCIFGRTLGFDFAKNEMYIGDCKAPISVTHGETDITLLVDRCSMEVFADGGKILMSCLNKDTVCDYNLPCLTVQADKQTVIEQLEICALDSIWDR